MTQEALPPKGCVSAQGFSLHADTYCGPHQRQKPEGRFKILVVERERYLLELCRYIVLNPVCAGLVRTP